MADDLLGRLEADPAGLARAEEQLQSSLKSRGIYFGDGLLPTYVVPFLVAQSRLARWIADSDALVEAIEQVAQAALGDPDLFAALRLRPDAQELMRIDPGYRRVTVLSRPDAVIVGEGLRFLEFNCDSPAMMTFSDAVTDCLLELEPLAPLRGRAVPERMTDQLLGTLLACYREYGGRTDTPSIAITDWQGLKTRYEHQKIAELFQAAGCPTVVCDPRAFRRVEGRLEVEGRAIDLVYRRALFTELLDRQGEVEPLLSAYRDGKICMVNPLRSYLASSKTLLALLCEDEAGRFTTPRARETIAASRRIAATDLERLRAEPDRWVLKRAESHGGLHVLLPGFVTAEERAHALDQALRDPWIMQAYHPVPTMEIVRTHQGRAARERKYYNWNPFLFGGRYAGAMARASDTPLINITLGGGLLPTLPYA